MWVPWNQRTLAPAVPQIPTAASLVVIAAVLATTTAASLLTTHRDPTARARAGSLRAHHTARTGQGTR